MCAASTAPADPPAVVARRSPFEHLVEHGGQQYVVPADTTIIGVLPIDAGFALVALRRRLRLPQGQAWPDAYAIQFYRRSRQGRWFQAKGSVTYPAGLAAGFGTPGGRDPPRR